jgi:hypothetical protein
MESAVIRGAAQSADAVLAGSDVAVGSKDRRVEPARTEVLMSVRSTIAERVRPFCEHLSEDEFDALVSRMALIEVKYTRRRQQISTRPEA